MPPTVREIASALGFASTNAVAGHITALLRKGLLEKMPGKSRGLKVKKGRSRRMDMLPVLGRIAAGRPIHAQEDIEGYVAADPFLVRDPSDSFVLKVEGDSMTGDGIMSGDYIFVHRQPLAERGRIVVALLEDEATVKRYVPMDDGSIRLESSNPAYDPIIVQPETNRDFKILGVVMGLCRRV